MLPGLKLRITQLRLNYNGRSSSRRQYVQILTFEPVNQKGIISYCAIIRTRPQPTGREVWGFHTTLRPTIRKVISILDINGLPAPKKAKTRTKTSSGNEREVTLKNSTPHIQHGGELVETEIKCPAVFTGYAL